MVKLSEVKIVFCDSTQALLQAYDEGLPKNVIIKTMSPAMLLDKNRFIKNLEDNINLKSWTNFFYSAERYVNKVFIAAIDDDVLRPFATTIARFVYAAEQMTLKAALLKDEDFEKPVAILNYRSRTKKINYLNSNPWKKLLSN